MTHLNAADDGGGESRVVLRAQHDGVHQNEAATNNTGGALLTLHVSWVAQIFSFLKSPSPISNTEYFQSVIKLHWIPKLISFLLVVTKTGSFCC